MPEMLHDQGIDNIITEQLQQRAAGGFDRVEKSSTPSNPKHTVKIAMVGKYVDLTESLQIID